MTIDGVMADCSVSQNVTGHRFRCNTGPGGEATLASLTSCQQAFNGDVEDDRQRVMDSKESHLKGKSLKR